jgi:cytochrome c oxidase assembly protein subunit 15
MVTGLNVLVVLWGAYVRASGSGNGCGDRWPLCNGVWLPGSARLQTLIEFVHRTSSAMALLSVVSLTVVAWVVTVRGSWARRAAVVSAVLIVNEALLGAALVLLGYVNQNRSAGRAFVLSVHFANTLLLLGTLALTAVWLTRERQGSPPNRSLLRASVPLRRGVLTTLTLALLTGVSGSLAALGDTLFPPTTLGAALSQDFTGFRGAGGHALLQIRLLHPLLALTLAAASLWLASAGLRLGTRQWGGIRRSAAAARAPFIAIVVFVSAQIALGIANVLLLAPIWMQILHLLGADLLWLALVVASERLLVAGSPAAAAPAHAAALASSNSIA